MRMGTAVPGDWCATSPARTEDRPEPPEGAIVIPYWGMIDANHDVMSAHHDDGDRRRGWRLRWTPALRRSLHRPCRQDTALKVACQVTGKPLRGAGGHNTVRASIGASGNGLFIAGARCAGEGGARKCARQRSLRQVRQRIRRMQGQVRTRP